MNTEYYILLSDGRRDGPYAEEEMLDLLEQGTLPPSRLCLEAASGRQCPAGELFHVIIPEPPAPQPPPPAIPWKPAPFPAEAPVPSPVRPPSAVRPRLLYHGSPCILTYWKAALLATTVTALAFPAGERFPGMLAVGLIAGPAILLAAVLHRLRSRYIITSARVELHEGLMLRSTRELRIADIRSIDVRSPGLSGLFGIGTIVFSPALPNLPAVVFHRVWKARALRNLVRRLQDTGYASGA